MALQTSVPTDWESVLKNLHICSGLVPSESSRRFWLFDAMTDLDVGAPWHNLHGKNPYASVPPVDTSYVELCLQLFEKFATEHDVVALALGDKDVIWKPARKQLTDANQLRLHKMILAYTDEALSSRAKACQRVCKIASNDRIELFGAKTTAFEDKCRYSCRVPGFAKALNPTLPAKFAAAGRFLMVSPTEKAQALKRSNATVFGGSAGEVDNECDDLLPYAYHERDASTLEELFHLANVGSALLFTPGAGTSAQVATRMKIQHVSFYRTDAAKNIVERDLSAWATACAKDPSDELFGLAVPEAPEEGKQLAAGTAPEASTPAPSGAVANVAMPGAAAMPLERPAKRAKTGSSASVVSREFGGERGEFFDEFGDGDDSAESNEETSESAHMG